MGYRGVCSEFAGGRVVTDFPTSNSRRPKRRQVGAAAPVFGGIAVFLWAFIFSVSQSLTKVTGTATMPLDLALGLLVGLVGGLLGALVVWLFLYFVLGRRHTKSGLMLLGVMAGIAVVGALPASGFRVIGAGMHAEESAVDEIRRRVDVRREAMNTRIETEREALVGQDFFESRALAAPGGLTRARTKVKALRDMVARSEVEDAQLQAQARAELAGLPVSGAKRALILRGFDESAGRETAEGRISIDLSQMMFDEMDAQIDILERRRWVLEYGQIAFTSLSDMNAFNMHADRIRDISTELNTVADTREQRLNASRPSR